MTMPSDSIDATDCISDANSTDTTDAFCDFYRPVLNDVYDVVDRIVLNGYFEMGCSPGGFRTWWQNLHGTCDNLDDTHLMRMAGRFSRRVYGWAKKNDIPILASKKGERKHKVAKQYLPKDPEFEGIFLVITSYMPAPVWKVLRFPSGGFHIKQKKPYPFVKHYFFHIMDKRWGHITICVSGHPPFRSMIILNGHEYTACIARTKGIEFQKEGNCFTKMSDSRQLAAVADTLRSPNAIGELQHVCDKWIYQCLCFAVSFDDQKRTGFRYRYSLYQMEYSRNLLFQNGRQMERIFDGMIDRTRSRLNIKTVTKIFGRKNRRFIKSPKRKTSSREEIHLEKPEYDLTVFKIHFGKVTLKIYTKGEMVLRAEAIAHDIKELGCGKILGRFHDMVQRLDELLTQFLNQLYCVDTPWFDDCTLDDYSKSGLLGRVKVGGIDLNSPRACEVIRAITTLSIKPGGFTVGDLAQQVNDNRHADSRNYTARQAAYDLRKFRAKDAVVKAGNRSRRYQVPPDGLRSLSGFVTFKESILRPFLARHGKRRSGYARWDFLEIDQCYQDIERHFQKYLRLLHFVKSTSKSQKQDM